MAAPTNTFASFDMVGIREDLSDIISDISPTETPWYSSIKKIKAKNTLHEWQTDALASPSEDNAHVEGDDTTAEAVTPTTRLNNQCQIFKKSVSISGTDMGLNKAGRAKEMAYQLSKRTKELKRDMEKSMFANKAKVTRGDATAGVFAGIGAWITTNTNNVGSGGSDPTGDGSDARTDSGTPTAFTQADFDLTMQNIWDEGGTPDRVYLSSFQMDVALDFTGMNNQRSTIPASESGRNAVINAIDVYVTPWGTVQFIPSRHVRSRDVWILQADKWAFANLRPVKNEELAKTGDSEKRQLVAEGTLVCYNEKANGGVVDCTTS